MDFVDECKKCSSDWTLFLPFSNHCDAAVVYTMIEHTYHEHKVYSFIARSGIGAPFSYIWYNEINLYSMRIQDSFHESTSAALQQTMILFFI